MQLNPQIILDGLAVRSLKLELGKNISQRTSGLKLSLYMGTVEVSYYTIQCTEGRRFSPATEHEWMELYEAKEQLRDHVLDVLDNLPISIFECIQIHAQCLILLELLGEQVPPGVPLRSLARAHELSSNSPLMLLSLFGTYHACHLEVDPELCSQLEGAPDAVLAEMQKVKKAIDKIEVETDQLLLQAAARLVQEWNAEIRKNPPLDPKDDERL
jgi:hypothetical protein